MTITGKIIRNVFSGWTYYFIQLAVGFFLMPFMVLHLGTEVYGLWILVFSFAACITFFDFGIRGSIVKYVAEFEAKKDFESLNRIINTSWVIHIIIGLSVAIIFFILSNFLGIFFKINPSLLSDFKICFRFMTIVISITLFFNIFVGILEGYKRTDIVSIIEIIAYVLQSALIIFFIIKGCGIASLGLIILIVTFAKQIARAILSFKVSPNFKLSLFLFDKKILKRIFNYSIFLFILEGLFTILNTIPNIMLGIFLGSTSIAFYSIAERLIGYFRTFLFSTSGVLVPFISSFGALNDKNRLKKSYILGSRYSYAIILFLGLVLIIMGKPFINLWMGEEFASKSYNVLVILIIPLFFSPSFFTIPALLKGLGRLKEITIFITFQVLLSIVLSVALIRAELIGIAFAISIPYFINFAIILPVLTLHILDISFTDYIKEVYLKSVVPAVIIFVTMSLLKNMYYPGNYITLISQILFSGAAYFIICFRLLISDDERNFYLSKINSYFRKA